MFLGIAVLVGLGLAVGWFFLWVILAWLGVPLESRKKREARAALALRLQQEQIEREAQRNIAVRAAEQRLAEGS